jgi:hypothetical protein
MRATFPLVLVFAACGGKSKPPAVTGNVAGSGSASASSATAAATPSCPSSPRDQLCACLAKGEVLVDDDTGAPEICDYQDDGKLPVHLLRTGIKTHTETFVAVEDGGNLHAIASLYDEAELEGGHTSAVSGQKLALETITGERVVRIDYHETSGLGQEGDASDAYDESVEGDTVTVCVLDGAHAGCPITSYTSCTYQKSDDSDPPKPANNLKGTTAAHVDIGGDGTVNVVADSATGTVGECAIDAKSTKVVP